MRSRVQGFGGKQLKITEHRRRQDEGRRDYLNGEGEKREVCPEGERGAAMYYTLVDFRCIDQLNKAS